MKEFIDIIKAEITKYNETILKSSNDAISKLDNLSSLTAQDLGLIVESVELSVSEQKTLESIVAMPAIIRELKLENVGLFDNEKQDIDSIKNKLKNPKRVSECVEKVRKYTEYLNALENNTAIKDFEGFVGLLDQVELPYETKIEILKIVNNNFLTKRHMPQEVKRTEKSDRLQFSDLEETNMSEEKWIELKEKYRIDWNKALENTKNLSRRNSKKEMLDLFESYLLRYGDYDKMDKILSLLSKNKLTSVFAEPEILTRTLLFSSVEQIEGIMKLLEESDVTYGNRIKLVQEVPTVLYPPCELPLPGNSCSGGLVKITQIITLFKQYGFDIDDVISKCDCIFMHSYAAIKRRLEDLKRYGIRLTNKNISALQDDILLDIDAAIEGDALGYIKDNITVARNTNLHVIKLIDKERSINPKLPFLFDSGGRLRRSEYTNYFKYSNQQIFEEYGAITPIIENRDMFDSVIENNKNASYDKDIVSKSELLSNLESNNATSIWCYRFDGVIISKLKVQRIYSILFNALGGDDFEALRYAIYYNSMLDSEELIKVENCIKERKLV